MATCVGLREPAGQHGLGHHVGGAGLADGCRPLASQLGTGLKTSPENASLLNGVSGHALDYDDVSASVEGHPSVVILPAALATAELVGASGLELLENLTVDSVLMRANLADAATGDKPVPAGAGELIDRALEAHGR